MSQTQELSKLLKENKSYNIRISRDLQGEKRLTQGKIGMFEKGFIFSTGQAEYPTHFNYLQFKEDKLIGTLCDNDDNSFCLSINTEEKIIRANCGYNSKGDLVKIWVLQKISQNGNKSIWKCKISVWRANEFYGLQYTETAKPLGKTQDGDSLYIAIDSIPLQIINYLNQQFNNLQMKRLVSAIVSKEDAPQWMVDNDHLHSGYRKNHHTTRGIIRSMCTAHNDTMNIWTHFIGAVVFVFMIVFLISNKQYSVAIYKEVRKDFENFQIQKFNEIFKEEMTNFVEQIKDKAKASNENFQKFQNDSLQQMHQKMENYKQSFTEFKSTIAQKKQVLLKNYDDFVNNVVLCKECLKSNFNKLKYTSNEKLDEYKHRLDIWIKDHKQQLLDKFPQLQDLEYYPMIVYMLSALFCLGSSAIFHLFYPLSKKTNDILQRLDMAGIAILIFGSCFACSYYLFYCQIQLMQFYTVIQIVTCLGVFIATLSEKFHKKEYVHLKGLLFGALGIGNGSCFVHAIYIYKYQKKTDILDTVLTGPLITGALYLTGLFFYIKKLPERLIPRKFDIWLNSHAIFHIFVFIASIQFYYTLDTLYHLRLSYKCF